MTRKGWLSKKDFDALDNLFSKLGYGGYYDFLECLKEIASKIGAFTVKNGVIDREDLKTINEVMGCLDIWSEAIFKYRLKKTSLDFDKHILDMLT